MADLLKLVANIDEINIADNVEDEDLLRELASQVIEDFNRDQESMSEWAQGIEDGRDIAKQEIHAKSEPWEGAANFKSPDILEAARAFGDRAVTEVVRGKDLVKASVIGRDLDGTKKKAAERVAEFMNYQINHQMEDWRSEQENLVYELPASGAVFKKTYFCPLDGVNKSELIHYPDFAINQATSTMSKSKAFTQIMDFSVNEIMERISAGIWSDVQIFPEDSEGAEGSNEEEEVDCAEENPMRFLEQNCLFDLDGDGYQEPYTVTVHEQSRQVVRIVARYSADGIFVRENTGLVRRASIGEPFTGVELVKIEPTQNITDYCFIKSIDGSFLGLGYYHLLAPLSKAINVLTNQLIDSGTLANQQGGFLARGFRKRLGSLRMRPGSFEQTDISAQDLQSGILMHQFKEPSPTLLNLRDGLQARIKELIVNLDLTGVLAPNAPATTTLALVQEAMMPSSAIMQRILGSMGREFKKLFILNSKFIDPIQYQTVLDDPQASFEIDFNQELMDVMPVANPEMSSRMQRIQLADALLLQVEKIQFTGGDVRPVMELYFDAIGADELIGQVYPTPEEMDEAQAARMAAQQQAQEDQQRLVEIQIDQAERELARKEAETQANVAEAQAKIAETNAKLEETAAEIEKIESETLLNLEKAESEEVKNQISMYTARLQGLRQTIETMRLANERVQEAPTGTPTGIPTLPTGQ